MPTQVARIPADQRDSFFLADMVPTVIDADKDAARAIHRRTLGGYVILPNYRNYWKAAGYEDEMVAIEDALAAGDRETVAALMTDAVDRRLHAVRLGQPRSATGWRRGRTPACCRSR